MVEPSSLSPLATFSFWVGRYSSSLIFFLVAVYISSLAAFSYAAPSSATSSSATANADQLADPMQPPGWGKSVAKPVKKTTPGFILQQTILRPGYQAAVINDRLLQPGDSIDGARVIKIEAQRVIIRHNQRQRALNLFNAAPTDLLMALPVKATGRQTPELSVE